jgi:hypothetical protein
VLTVPGENAEAVRDKARDIDADSRTDRRIAETGALREGLAK